MSLPNITSYPGIYQYQHLPVLAKFILDEHLRVFAEQQLKYARQYSLPLLKFLAQYSDEQLIEISMGSVAELLGYLINNKPAEQIDNSLQKWLANQLDVVGKYDIAAEDITLLNHVRGKSLRNFAYKLYNDDQDRYDLLDEIDDFLLSATTAAANTYISILKDRINEEEEFKSKLSNALPGSVYVINLQEQKVLHANDKLSQILGYSTAQLNAATIDFYQSITHPDDWMKIIEHRNDLSDNNVVSSIEIRFKDRKGNYKWLRSYETNLRRNDDGEINEVIGVAFDVTGEKAITEALAVREAQLLEAQTIAHIGSFEWDITGRNSTTNTPETYKIFELEGMEKFEQFMAHVHNDDVKLVEEALRQSFKTGNYDCIFRYLRNGIEKIIWSKGVVTIVGGIAVKMVGTVQDVTTIKRIEAELKAKTIELQKSNESLQQFASIASHDLKEPLRKISVFGSKVLNQEKDKLSNVSKAALNKIFDSARRMQQMIDDILQFSFTQGNQQKQQTNLEEVVSEVKELLSENISDKNAVVFSDGLPPACVIAPQMRQLFQNLIANALKFSRDDERPQITITHSYHIDKPAVSIEKKLLEIRIADNGIGFNQEDHEKIFGLFYRLHSRAEFEGNGLGLSICKKIVENHNGKITAESKLGEGATFKILLPV